MFFLNSIKGKLSNTSKRRIYIILLSFLIVVVIAVLAFMYKEEIISFVTNKEISENVKFKREYTKVSDDNVFKISTYDEVVEILKSGTGIVFFGFPSCPWCQAYAPILDEIAKEYDIDKIYYYNIKEIRKNNTEEYVALVELLKQYLETDDNNAHRIYVPDVYFVKDGKIVGHNNDTSMLSGADTDTYYTEEVRANLKDKLRVLIKQIVNNSCPDDEEGC